MKPMERYSYDGFSKSGVFFMNAYGGKSIVLVKAVTSLWTKVTHFSRPPHTHAQERWNGEIDH